jgi:hypothetical protein
MRDRTATWEGYVRGRHGRAWKQALTLLGQVTPAYHMAAANKPGLAMKHYPDSRTI